MVRIKITESLLKNIIRKTLTEMNHHADDYPGYDPDFPPEEISHDEFNQTHSGIPDYDYYEGHEESEGLEEITSDPYEGEMDPSDHQIYGNSIG
jgi:hypothetical protein